MGSKHSIPDLNVSIKTWNTNRNESEALFDYTSQDIDEVNRNISSATHIINENGKIIFKEMNINSENSKNSSSQIIMNIVPSKNNYKLITDFGQNLHHKYYVWKSFRYAPPIIISEEETLNFASKLFYLDIIRMGKSIFKINKIYIPNKNLNNSKDENVLTESENKIDSTPNNQLYECNEERKENKILIKENQIEDKKQNERICRICLEGEFSSNNPLVIPCKCKGSMKYLHLNCLKQWIEKKIVIKKYKYITIYCCCRELCELCKSGFQDIFQMGEKKASYYGIEIPKCPYIEFELIENETINVNHKENRMIYHIKMDNVSKIVIGRGHDADFKINDISVSRSHATLYFTHNTFYLIDHESKFGTLCHINRNLIIRKKENFIVQSGRSIFAFTSIVPCFSCRKEILEDEEDEQIETEFFKDGKLLIKTYKNDKDNDNDMNDDKDDKDENDDKNNNEDDNKIIENKDIISVKPSNN